MVHQPNEGSVGYGVYDPEATVHIKNINENKKKKHGKEETRRNNRNTNDNKHK